MWLNQDGIANLLSIPQLEEDGFSIDKTNIKWVVITPKGERIPFKLGVGLCKGMPYINLRKSHGFDMLETIRANYEGFTKRKGQQAIQAHKTQTMVANLTYESF